MEIGTRSIETIRSAFRWLGIMAPVPDTPLDFVEIKGLEHIHTTELEPARVSTRSARARTAENLLAHLQQFPSATAVVATVAGDEDTTQLVVASRPDAVKQPVLEGIFEVQQRLGSSSILKELARVYPSRRYTLQEFGGSDQVKSFSVPGPHTQGTVASLLRDGGDASIEANYRALAELVEDLPKGRVAILLAGGSAAGKSRLVAKIEELAAAKERKVTVLGGDQYFRDADDPEMPRTQAGTAFWDHPDYMHVDDLKEDIGDLLARGQCDLPRYNFHDSPPGFKRLDAPLWQAEGNLHGFREDQSDTASLAQDGILVLDSIHAGHRDIVAYLKDLGLKYRTVFVDSPSADDRLLRRVVRDYQERDGIGPSEAIKAWDQSVWPGETGFIRPAMLEMNPARDAHLILTFPQDLGLTRQQLEERGQVMEELGLPPTYENFAKTPQQLRG